METLKLLEKDFVKLSTILFAFFVFTLQNPKLITYRFEESKIGNYLRSQDILDTEDRIKDRITVSDSDIYEATGVLYQRGADPRDYNFQHPPLAKYLFGYSVKLLGNPYVVQIFFAVALLFGVYFLGKLIFKKSTVGFFASLLLLIDPVFKEITLYTLLDLSQMAFFIWFLVAYFFFPKRKIISGILLGASLASKFYSPIIFYLGVIYIWKIYGKKFVLRHELTVLAFAFLTFCLTYFESFPFNIFFWQAKIIKFMLVHDSTNEWGSILPMFFGGYFLWPVSFFATCYLIIKEKTKNLKFLLFLLPTTHILLMCFQTPFERYFILILPFLYLGLTDFAVRIFRKS
jgi:hypothetical protein